MRIDGPKITGSFSLGNTVFPDLNSLATTASINSLSSSVATTGSNLFKGTQTLSGSILPAINNTYDLGSPTQQFRHVYISTGSLYIDGTKVLGSTSSELQITTDVGQSFKVLETGADTITLQSADGNVTLTSTGGGDVVIDPNTGVIGLKGTVTIYTGNKIVSSDGNSIQFGNGIAITGSIVATGTSLVSGSSQVLNGSGVWSGSAQLPSGIISGSSQVLNGSGIWSGSSQLPNGIVSSSAQVTGYGFSTTGSNNFIGTQTITGSLYISQNLIVQGSSSLQDVTGSNVYIGTNKINLNTATPSIRFGGISVFDSGSNFGESGSLLWDSQNNRWLYQHPASSGAPYKSAIIIAGPQNSGSLGSETTLTSGKISKAVGDDHIGDSIMTETGGGIGISGSLSITGSIVATGTSLWSGSGQLPSGVVSGSAQIVSSLPSGVISGSAQLPSGTVSGSAQVDVLSTTNIARIATTGSNSFNGTQTFGYGRLVSTGYNSSAQITINASYDGGQTNTYTPDYAGDSTAGMFVMKQSNGGYGDFNFYGKNHQTTGGSHNISTFNVIMGMNTNGRVAIGKLTANTPLDVNGNTMVTGSITSVGSSPLLKFINTSAGAGGGSIQFYSSSVQLWNLGTHTNNDMYLYNNTTSTYNIWVQNSNGYVGINKSSGTTNAQLDVNGSVLISGSLTTANAGITNQNTYLGNGQLRVGGGADHGSNTVLSIAPGVVKVDAPGVSGGRLILDNNGYLGINTTDISQYLGVWTKDTSTGAIRVYGSSTSYTGTMVDIGSETSGSTYTLLNVRYGSGMPNTALKVRGDGYIGVNDTSPSKRLSVNYGSTQLGGMTVYGSMRQETIFKSTGEHCFIYIDSAHSSTYYPMLSLQRNSTTYGTVQLQRASNSDTYSTFTESEMVVGTTTQTPISLQMNGNRKLIIDTNGNTNITGTAIINGALTVNNNGFSLKGWRQYAVQISAGGSTNTGAIIFRQFQDSVNWNTGGVVVEIINYSYANSEYDTRKDFARYGYSGNAAAINTIYGNITGKIPQPYWGAAVQGSGVYYYRDLMIDIPPYHAYVINLTTAMSLNGNSTVGNGTIYLFS